MAMEEEEDAEIEHVFVAHEIDLDYEFDAARFFDFTRPETLGEAFDAELWFQNAPTYPPSPFVTKLVAREDFLLGDVVEDSPKSKNVECTSNVDEKEAGAPPAMEICETANGLKAFAGTASGLLAGIQQNVGTGSLQVPLGLTSGSKEVNDSLNSDLKSAVPKSSTLPKTTAGQLTKQNRAVKNVGSRFQKLRTQTEKNLCTASGVESQAAKRQKLESGLLRKVTDVKPQTNFVHKKPMRAVTVEQNSACSKLRLTIPREPDLQTAHRAQRIRPKNVGEAEHMAVSAPRFKARPLNRRILDAPSLPLPKRSTPRLPEFREFHLKTSERAMQHTSATQSTSHCNDSDKGWDKHTVVSALENRIKNVRRPTAMQHTSATQSTSHCNDSDKGWDKHTVVSALENRIKNVRRPTAMDAPKHDGLGFTHIFKAQPINKKIASSKEHVGVFPTNKKETTEPMEFDLHMEKGFQDNPPIELFSKLSLKSEGQPNNGSHFKLPQQSGMCRKDSKENILNSFRLDQEEKAFMFGEKQIHQGNESCLGLISARRSLGIR